MGIGATTGGLLAEEHGAEPRGRLIRGPHKIGRSPGQFAGAAARGAEQGSLLRLRDPGCVQIGFEIVVEGISWTLPPFSRSRTHHRLPWPK